MIAISRLSVRPSVKRVICDKMEERSVQIFIPYERSFSEKNGWWGRSILPEILGQTDRVGAKSPIFNLFFARNTSAVTPSEKSSANTNRKSTTRFPISQNKHCS